MGYRSMRNLCRRALILLVLALVATPALSAPSSIRMTIIIFFGVAEHEVGAHYYDQLEDVKVCVEASASRRVEIAAYTDTSGSAAANRLLSQRRADAVAAALVAAGLPAQRITGTEGHGENDPLARDGDSVATVSRRAEILVIDDGETTELSVGDVAGPRVTERSCDQL